MALGVVAMISAVLFLAPLVLGTYVISQAASRDLLMRWFAFVSVLFGFALLLGILALFTIP